MFVAEDNRQPLIFLILIEMMNLSLSVLHFGESHLDIFHSDFLVIAIGGALVLDLNNSASLKSFHI